MMTMEGEGRPHKGCGGPLGFGSREADMCLRDARPSLSAPCQAAIAETEALFRSMNAEVEGGFVQIDPWMDEYDYVGADEQFHHHHHLSKLGGMFFIFFFSLCMCGRCAKRKRQAQMKHLLKTLHAHPELKAAVEDAAGSPLPLPGFKHKMLAAINANPELKTAVEDATQQKLPRGPRAAPAAPPAKDGKGASKCSRCVAMVLVVISTLMIIGAASGLCHHHDDAEMMEPEGGEPVWDEEEYEAHAAAQDDTSPLAGFLFSIFFGFMLIMTCNLLCKCVRALCVKCCGCGPRAAAATYPGAKQPRQLLRKEGNEVTVVYVGLPASAEDVPPIEKL